FLHAFGDLGGRRLGKSSWRRYDWRGQAADLIVVPSDLVDGVRPAVRLTFDVLLHHPERRRLRAPFVFEGPCDRRNAREPDLLSQLPSDLEVGIDPRFDPAEQF